MSSAHGTSLHKKEEDPIADFELTDIDLLDSALQQPKWDYYERIEKKQLFFTTA